MHKRIICLLAALCALWLPAFATNGGSTALHATVPSQHTITVSCGAGGSVRIGGVTRGGAFDVTVPRHDTLTVHVVPDAGYALSHVAVDRACGSLSLSKLTITLAGVYNSATLSITFVRTHGPTPTPTPKRTPKPVPTPSAPKRLSDFTPTGNVLYDDYLGTALDDGLIALDIVDDARGDPVDYELLAIVPDERIPEGALLIHTVPDANGEYPQRSLSLTTAQVTRLSEECEMSRVLFRNGDCAAIIDMADLLSGPVLRVAELLMSGMAVTPERIAQARYGYGVPELTAEQQQELWLEIAITPSVGEDGATYYTLSVLMHFGNSTADVTDMLPSLRIALFASRDSQSTILHGAGDAQSDLAAREHVFPDDLLDLGVDVTDLFNVSMANGADRPVVLYQPDAYVDGFVMLTAEYPGEPCRLAPTERSE